MTVAFWIAATLSAISIQQAASVDPPVELRVAVYLYNADGSMGGSAGGPIKAVDSVVWISFSPTSCGLGAGALPQTSSAYTWKSTGHIVSHEGDRYSIEVIANRTSATMSDPPGNYSERLQKVQLGEHVVLDEVSNLPGPCLGRTARLEASVELASPSRGTGASGSGRGGATTGVGAAGGVSTGPIAGGRAGARPAPGAPMVLSEKLSMFRPADVRSVIAAAIDATDDGTGERSFMAVPGSSSMVPVVLHPMQASFRAELWLVDTAPDGTQLVHPVVGHLDDAGSTFSPLAPARASTTVAVNLRPMWTGAERAVLRVVLARFVNGGEAFGMSNRSIPLPGPGEVVSFEMPMNAAQSDPLAGHRFELRVRLTPAG
jgi:hypothetical protein